MPNKWRAEQTLCHAKFYDPALRSVSAYVLGEAPLPSSITTTPPLQHLHYIDSSKRSDLQIVK